MRQPSYHYADRLRCPDCKTETAFGELIDGWAITCPNCGRRDRTDVEWEHIG